jgi:hypothetical protein
MTARTAVAHSSWPAARDKRWRLAIRMPARVVGLVGVTSYSIGTVDGVAKAPALLRERG